MAGYAFVLGTTDVQALKDHPSFPDDPPMPDDAKLDFRSRELFRAANWGVSFTGVIHFTGHPATIYLMPLIASREGNEEFGLAVTKPDYENHGSQQRIQRRPDTISDSAGVLAGGSLGSKTYFHPNMTPQGRDSKLFGKEVREALPGHDQICREIKQPADACVGFAVTKSATASLITGNSRTCNSTKFHGTSMNLGILGVASRDAKLKATGSQFAVPRAANKSHASPGSGFMPIEWMRLIERVLIRDLGEATELAPVEKRFYAGTYKVEGDMPSPGSQPIQKPNRAPPAPPPPKR